MACNTCKKKKVILPPNTDDRILMLSDEEKESMNNDLDRMTYLLGSRNFRSSEGEFTALYRKTFEINLPTPVNQTVVSKFIFKYKKDNAKLLLIGEKEIKKTPTKSNTKSNTKSSKANKDKTK